MLLLLLLLLYILTIYFHEYYNNTKVSRVEIYVYSLNNAIVMATSYSYYALCWLLKDEVCKSHCCIRTCVRKRHLIDIAADILPDSSEPWLDSRALAVQAPMHAAVVVATSTSASYGTLDTSASLFVCACHCSVGKVILANMSGSMGDG